MAHFSEGRRGFVRLFVGAGIVRHVGAGCRRPITALTLTVIVTACTLWILILAWNSGRTGTHVNHSPDSVPGQSARGVRTSVVRDNRVALRASADEITVRRPKTLGPFRIGFLRSVAARGVAVEIFEERRGQPHPLESAPPVTDSLAHLLPGTDARRLAKVEVEGFSFTRYQDGQAIFALQARRCETTAAPKGLRCNDGVIRSESGQGFFKNATFAHGTWEVD
jgi:hypothetical protein